MVSSPRMPAGRRPSSNSFSSLIISSKLLAFLILSCSLCFSLSVSFRRFILEPDAAEPFAEGALNVWDLIPIICRNKKSAPSAYNNAPAQNQNPGRGISGCAYLRRQLRRLLDRAKQLRRLLPLGLLDLLVVQEPHRGTPPHHPVPVLLRHSVSRRFPTTLLPGIRHGHEGGGAREKPTSFFVTGLSISTRCVSRANLASASRSDSSDRLFEASTRFVRLGMAFGRLGWIVATRLRASRSVCIRGDSGKLPRFWMSLSVRSIESCG